MFLALVVLLGHQRVVEPGSAQAAVFPSLSSAVSADHRQGPSPVRGGRRAGGGVCGQRGGRGGVWRGGRGEGSGLRDCRRGKRGGEKGEGKLSFET